MKLLAEQTEPPIASMWKILYRQLVVNKEHHSDYNLYGNIDDNQLISKLTELLGKEIGSKSTGSPEIWVKIIKEYVKSILNNTKKKLLYNNNFFFSI